MYGRGHQRWGAREKIPVEREEKVCARESSRHRDNVFVRETPRKTTIDGPCRRELSEGIGLLVSWIEGRSERGGS